MLCASLSLETLLLKYLALDKAHFWIYVRHELVVAVLNERPLKLPANTWNVPYIKHHAITEHDLTQELLWLVGRGIDLAYGLTTADNRQELASDVAQWFTRPSPQFRGIRYGSKHRDQLTRCIFQPQSQVSGFSLNASILLHNTSIVYLVTLMGRSTIKSAF